MGDAQNHERVGLRLFDELTIGPGVDRPAALKVDVRREHAAQLRRGPIATGDRNSRTRGIDKELLELSAQGTRRGGVRPARHRGRPAARFSKRLMKRVEGRAFNNHRRVEPVDQTLKLMKGKKEPRRTQHPALDFDQRRLAVKLADDVVEAVDRDRAPAAQSRR